MNNIFIKKMPKNDIHYIYKQKVTKNKFIVTFYN